MGRSQETSGKKEVRNRKDKKRKDKAQKRALKKSEGKSNPDDMIAYVDEYGKISSTPPDPTKRTKIIAENIEINVPRNRPENVVELVRKGVVTFFNESKGFGFIRDLESSQRIFVHANGLLEPIVENNLVVFEIVKGPKGPSAIKVKLFKEPTA